MGIGGIYKYIYISYECIFIYIIHVYNEMRRYVDGLYNTM